MYRKYTILIDICKCDVICEYRLQHIRKGGFPEIMSTQQPPVQAILDVLRLLNNNTHIQNVINNMLRYYYIVTFTSTVRKSITVRTAN